MNSFTKSIPPLTPAQIAEIENLKKMTDADIDLSDIPEITHEEFERMRAIRLRRKKIQKLAS